MFGSITSAQIVCSLGDVSWESLIKWGESFWEIESFKKEEAKVQAHFHSKQGHLQIDRFALQPELLPWSYRLSLTLFRETSPLDSWLAVQLASDLSQTLNCMSYCDPPEELGILSAVNYWQLGFFPETDGGEVHLIRYDEYDVEHIQQISSQKVSLRNFPLFSTRIPYFLSGNR